MCIRDRGGGSFEDLAAFNDEELAKRIFKCKIPVISGVDVYKRQYCMRLIIMSLVLIYDFFLKIN